MTPWIPAPLAVDGTISLLWYLTLLVAFASTTTVLARDTPSSTAATTNWLQFQDANSCNTTLISDVPPPLRFHQNSLEHERERKHQSFVDDVLDHHWRGTHAHASSTNNSTNHQARGREYTYGEVTPLGVRQLFHEMNIGGVVPSTNTQSSVLRQEEEYEEENGGVVFYDLGSGVGRLVVQLYLDHNHHRTNDPNKDEGSSIPTKSERVVFHKIVGIELSHGRHAVATESWKSVQASLDTTLPPEQNEPSLQQQQQQQQQQLQVVYFFNQDILATNFSDATHLYISSLCFPPEVTHRLSEIILSNVSKNKYGDKNQGTLKVVAALSDLPLFEQKEQAQRWTKTTRNIQMTWGGGKVRTYTYIPSFVE